MHRVGTNNPGFSVADTFKVSYHGMAHTHIDSLLDNCDLEAISIAAQQQRRWEFLLVVAPLAMPGGTGSPVNPIATF